MLTAQTLDASVACSCAARQCQAKLESNGQDSYAHLLVSSQAEVHLNLLCDVAELVSATALSQICRPQSLTGKLRRMRMALRHMAMARTRPDDLRMAWHIDLHAAGLGMAGDDSCCSA